MPSEKEPIFSGCRIYIHPEGLGPKRLSLFETHIMNHGGTLLKNQRKKLLPTHVVVDESIAKDIEQLNSDLCKEKFGFSEKTKFVLTQWLSRCLKEKQLVDMQGFQVFLSCDRNIMQNVNAKRLLSKESSSNSKEQCLKESTEAQGSPLKKMKTEFSEASSDATTQQYNQQIIEELQKLADAFRSSGDQWRAHGYNKAVSAIKEYSKPITRCEDVASLPNIGQKMLAKIQEIIEFGKLRKVDEICNNEKVKVVELFNKVWGAGPSTAESWYYQGYRTLEDLETKANLNKQQRMGLKYFDDIQESITRKEVERIFAVVKEAALSIEPSLQVMLVGSYRRGKDMCGDVDVLISKEDSVTNDILTRIIIKLKETGFISDDLVSTVTQGKQKKYLGLCRLPGETQKHRRLDIFLVPQSEFGPALMHYTGGALFNRSIRIYAAKKDMSLSEHSLMGGVVREGKDKVSEGYVLPTPTEESIFEHLGLPYRPAEKRNHCL